MKSSDAGRKKANASKKISGISCNRLVASFIVFLAAGSQKQLARSQHELKNY
jgi:hypothetical protein